MIYDLGWFEDGCLMFKLQDHACIKIYGDFLFFICFFWNSGVRIRNIDIVKKYYHSDGSTLVYFRYRCRSILRFQTKRDSFVKDLSSHTILHVIPRKNIEGPSTFHYFVSLWSYLKKQRKSLSNLSYLYEILLNYQLTQNYKLICESKLNIISSNTLSHLSLPHFSA